jgi:hypothetical protein
MSLLLSSIWLRTQKSMQMEGSRRLKMLLLICVVLARGLSSNCCILFLAFPFAARRLSKDHFLFSSERSEETFTNVMDGELILISGSLVKLLLLICSGFKKWYFFLDWRLRCV